MLKIVWSEYLKYRATLRGFRLDRMEDILKHSDERYFDQASRRMVVVGKHDRGLVMIPYDQEGDMITPVTVHAVSRLQIKFRVKSGRFIP